MNAWLLTWEGTEGPALVADRKIIAILSGRRSSGTIANLVEVLYCRSVDTAYDMAQMANKRGALERQYLHTHSTGSRIFYGRNPCIFARQVMKLSIRMDESMGTELLTWTELPVYRNAKVGSGIEEAEPARECRHIRALRPLSLDLYEHVT